MGEWSEQFDRQIAGILSQCAKKQSFGGTTAEELWLWQGHQRGKLKESLALEMATVYGPPKAELVHGHPGLSETLQVWQVQTEPGIHRPLYLQYAATPAARAGVVLQLGDPPQSPRDFCREVSCLGLTAAVSTLRAGADPLKQARAAELYLSVGKSYAGLAVADLLRILDHLENQLELEGEPIILILSGVAIPIGLSLAAIDQRIGGVILEFSGENIVGGPTGCPPLFVNTYVLLGANPTLSLAQCCAPKPMLMVDFPISEDRWLGANPSGVLSAMEQLEELQRTYEVSGHPERLDVASSADDGGQIELLKTFFKNHFIAV